MRRYGTLRDQIGEFASYIIQHSHFGLGMLLDLWAKTMEENEGVVNVAE
jgi:hypothetical protein